MTTVQAEKEGTAEAVAATGQRIEGVPDPTPNRVATGVEEAILAHSLEQPTHGAQRVADELLLKEIQVSAGGEIYNTKRPHRGRGMESRTRTTSSRPVKPNKKRATKTTSKKEVKAAA